MQLEFLYLTFRSQPGVQDVHLRCSCSFDTDTILLRINKNKKNKTKKKQEKQSYFMHDNVTADTTNFSLTAPEHVFGKRLTTGW